MYKLRLAIVVAAVLLAGASLRADDEADIKMMLDKAIKAAGGADKVAMLKNVTWKAKGKLKWTEKKQAVFKADGWAQGWDRARFQVTFEGDEEDTDLTLILNTGEKVWLNGWNIGPAAKEQFALRDIYYFGLRAPQMLPALLGNKFQLSKLKEVKVRGQPAIGLRIARKDQPDVSLFFDKKTSLPVMTELHVPKENGIDAIEVHYSDYKESNGLKHFTKIILKIAKVNIAVELMTMELSDVRPQKKLAASLFDGNVSQADTKKLQPAFVTVRVPAADAEVWINGRRTRQGGKERIFESPPLEPGEYAYEIRAKWRQGGKDMDQTRTVDVQPGQRVIVDFSRKK